MMIHTYSKLMCFDISHDWFIVVMMEQFVIECKNCGLSYAVVVLLILEIIAIKELL